ncbi:MAG TPA: hypothetical protein VN924_12025 [Bryobacteraceae bacterium]|nr:hypothetical protein [Bryobacteraceae bacterium]
MTTPQDVATGRLVMDLDPSVFASIGSVAVFGAHGDAYGMATVSGLHLDAQFSSGSGAVGALPELTPASGGIGQVRGLPVLVVNAAVLASAPVGSNVSIAADPSQSPWNDPQGNPYSVSVSAGSLTVGGSLSVQNIAPGGGILPAGTVVQVLGTGFTAVTTVQVDEAGVSAVHLIGPQEIDVTLAAQAELTVQRFLLGNLDKTSVEYFSFLQAVPPPASASLLPAQPLFPLQTWSTQLVTYFPAEGGVLALENPTQEPVSVTFQAAFAQTLEGPLTLTIPADGLAAFDGTGLLPAPSAEISVVPPGPIRILQFSYCGCTLGSALTVLPLYPSGASFPTAAPPVQATASPASLSWQWQIGSPAPPARTVSVNSVASFTIAASTASGGAWLSAALEQDAPSILAVAVNPIGLSAGSYQGAITISPSGLNTLTIPVSLTVTPNPVTLLLAAPASLTFNGTYGEASPPAQSISVTGSSPGNFTVSVDQGVYEAGYWLSVSPASGTTPATLTVSADTAIAGVNGGYGIVAVTGPQNTLSIPVTFNVAGITAPPPMFFSAQTGAPPQTQTVDVGTGTVMVFSASASTNSGGAWLSVATSPIFLAEAYITANPANLSPGTYTGTVVFSVPGAPSVQTTVTVVVWGTPPPLSVTPSSLLFVYPMGSSAIPAQTLSVQSGGVPLPLTVQTSLACGSNCSVGLGAYSPSSFSPATFQVTFLSASYATGPPAIAPEGYYQGNVQITAPSGTVTVPVSVLVTASPVAPPLIGALVNAASQTQGSVAPGEIVTIYGFGVGPPYVSGFWLNSNSSVGTYDSGIQVLFDGKPAPLIYASRNQTNAIVPYEVADQTSTTAEVVYNGVTSATWGVPVATAAPAIFTGDAIGNGQAAVLNQDNSVNSSANPAPRGTVVQIFATGEGQTLPPGVTGSMTQSNLKKPVLPVCVMIGGVDAPLLYAGSAPDAVAGLLQINAVVPQTVSPGPAIPISIMIGDLVSPNGVTIAVQ